jgi:hypothetical protein
MSEILEYVKGQKDTKLKICEELVELNRLLPHKLKRLDFNVR